MAKFLMLAIGAALAAYAVHAFAQLRADVRPPLTPVGTSSSNGVSFVWFYDPPERSVVVCRMGSAANDQPDCTRRAALP